jgi:hypothetical protein
MPGPNEQREHYMLLWILKCQWKFIHDQIQSAAFPLLPSGDDHNKFHLCIRYLLLLGYLLSLMEDLLVRISFANHWTCSKLVGWLHKDSRIMHCSWEWCIDHVDVCSCIWVLWNRDQHAWWHWHIQGVLLCSCGPVGCILLCYQKLNIMQGISIGAKRPWRLSWAMHS